MGYPSLATAALIGWEWPQREAHIFIRFVAEHYRPPDRPNHVYVINYKTSTGSWEPLFNAEGKALYPLLMAELDAVKALRPTGGLMLPARRQQPALVWQGRDADPGAADLEEDNLGRRFAARADLHSRSVGTAGPPNLNRPD
jgi:hypothetical protein